MRRAFKCPVYRAFVCDFQQALFLFLIKRPAQADFAAELIHFALICQTGILSMNFVMADIDTDTGQRPFFAARIHPYRHGRAGAQTG